MNFQMKKKKNYTYLKIINIYAAKKFFSKQTMIVNHTIDCKTNEFKRIIKAVYPTCDYISVREPKSQRKLASMEIKSTLTADSAFIYSEKSNIVELREKFHLPDKYYVFFLSQLIDVDSIYLKQLCQEIFDTLKLPAVFFILSQRETNVIKNIKNTNIPCTIIDYFVEPEEIIEVLKYADFCLSGRFHTTIFSAIANTPFIGFRANTHKIASLIEMMEYPIPELILGKTDISEIRFYIKIILKNKDTIKSSLDENVSKAKKLSRENNIKIIEGRNIKKSLIRIIRDEVEFLIQSINPMEWHRW